MLIEQFNKLPEIWKITVYKEWLLFIKHQFPLSVFLWDDSYGIDFLLCRVLKLESNNPEGDLNRLNDKIQHDMKNVSLEIADEIFSMQFLVVPPEITYLSPLKFFPCLKVLDFHCQNQSMITDFDILKQKGEIFVLDYADYMIIDFEKFSNIKDYPNIKYIKQYGFPSNMGLIYSQLKIMYTI